MDPIPQPQQPPQQPPTQQHAVTAPGLICPQCHQPIQPEYYFCPNCGKKLSEAPTVLSTSIAAQCWLYVFSLILPFIGYLAITKWEGITYARSNDPKAEEIGWIAIGLLTLSSIFVLWQATVWINGFIQTQTSTAGLSQFGI